jgi:hypothetical protein
MALDSFSFVKDYNLATTVLNQHLHPHITDTLQFVVFMLRSLSLVTLKLLLLAPLPLLAYA